MDETEARFRALERRVEAVDLIATTSVAWLLRTGAIPPSLFDSVALSFADSARRSASERRAADDQAVSKLARIVLAMADDPEVTPNLRLVHDLDPDPPKSER